jgi:predicted PurR-regulated permease PerM
VERIVTVRPRTVLMVAAVAVAVVAALQLVLAAERALVWVFVAVFLAMALNPAVDWLQRHGVRRRGAAVGVVYLLATMVIAGVGALIVPTLIQQVQDLVKATPEYVGDLTQGRGPLGFLETKYHVVERVQEAVKGGGGGVADGASVALDVTRSVVTFLAAVVTITFLTLFMLLEGADWKQRAIGLLPERSQPRWEAIAGDVYRTVGGYVTGNLTISLIAGMLTTAVLLVLGVPYALALGLVVAILDLIPLAGATLAAIIVSLVAATESVTSGVIVLTFFVVYQQIENHILQPIIYGKAIRLSPLAILVSVLIGAEVAGVLGVLAAIPIAGSVQIVIKDFVDRRRTASDDPDDAPDAEQTALDGSTKRAPPSGRAVVPGRTS